MYGWVSAVRHNLPSVSIEKAVAQFAKFYDLEDFNIDVGIKTYYRMLQENRDYDKSE